MVRTEAPGLFHPLPNPPPPSAPPDKPVLFPRQQTPGGAAWTLRPVGAQPPSIGGVYWGILRDCRYWVTLTYKHREFHGTQQVSIAFFLLQSYFRDSMRSHVDSNRAANIHGNLPPIHERQRPSSQTLLHRARPHHRARPQRPPSAPSARFPAAREGSAAPAREQRPGALCVRPRPPAELPEFRFPPPSRPQPRWRRGRSRSRRGRLGAGPGRPDVAEGRCQAGGCPGVRLSGPSTALSR